MKRKLIEVALPLEAINKESAREKSIRHGHPSTLHLWWARRPLAAARAVLFAQLVDDPSSRPEEFPTEEAQRSERERLHRLIERLVVWENIRDEKLLAEARAEILKSTDGNPPPILDPFAGGGTIPLEAKRLGLEAYANDLNPLPVLINIVLLELIDRFEIRSSISQATPGRVPECMAEDLRHYAEVLEQRAAARVGALYPGAGKARPLVYFWARTVSCVDPACQVEVPLLGSWTASARRGSETSFRPVLNVADHAYDIEVAKGASTRPGTMTRTGAVCPRCGASLPLKYIKDEGVNGRLGARLLALQVRDGNGRRFVAADREQRDAAKNVPAADTSFLESELSTHSQYMAPPRYGMRTFRDLFTPRQLAMLTAFVEELDSVQQLAEADALAAGMSDDARPYADGGSGARAYGDAIRILLALGVGRLTNRASTLCIWDSTRDNVQQVFSRQAYSMTWLFAEANPFAGASGSFSGQAEFLAKSLAALPLGKGRVTQGPAQSLTGPVGVAVSTDPPYYDNVPYGDLSDFFLVWHRRMLQHTLPIFRTLLSPKNEELVADHVRWGGREAAKSFFESGFRSVFASIMDIQVPEVPMAVYYAFRQSDVVGTETGSTGWETLLEALLSTGWSVQGTWPMRTEQAGGLRSLGRNALASSVVVVARRRSSNSVPTDRRAFVEALRAELPVALRQLQLGRIAPVDLPQAAIGPGMAVFSRYTKVIEPDGSEMTVRSALARINEVLDQVLSEQEGDFDAATRFAIAWYRQQGYGTGSFGDADNLARARNTSVDHMDRSGVLTSRAGKVTLVKPLDAPDDYDVTEDDVASTWEVLHHTIRVFENDGIQAAGVFLRAASARPDRAGDPDLLKELAFLLFSIAEKNGWTKDAIWFNNVAQSWGDVTDAAKSAAASTVQGAFDLEDDD